MDDSNPYQSPTVNAPSPKLPQGNRRLFPRVVAAIDLVGIVLLAAAFAWGVYIQYQIADDQQLVWSLGYRLDTWITLSVAVLGLVADSGILFHRRWAIPVGYGVVVVTTVRIAWGTWTVVSPYVGNMRWPPAPVLIIVAMQATRAAWTICYFTAIRSYHAQWASPLPPYIRVSRWR